MIIQHMPRDDHKNNRALDLIRKVTDEVENINPTRDEMISDIKMMKFKIRSISGNIFDLTNQKFGFVESLWRVAKIEEIVAGAIDTFNDKDREILFRFLDNLEMSVQEKIFAMVDQLPPDDRERARVLKVEIFREPHIKKKDLN